MRLREIERGSLSSYNSSRHETIAPAQTLSTCPAMPLALSEATKATVLAVSSTSSGRPSTFSAIGRPDAWGVVCGLCHVRERFLDRAGFRHPGSANAIHADA